MSSGQKGRYALVADIGGTNARFALVAPGQLQPEQQITLAVDDFGTIDSAIRAYLEQVGIGEGEAPCEACLAIACPTSRDRISMTNNGWVFSRSELQHALGLVQLQVINDYAAQAYAAPHLKPDELFRVGGGEALTGHPIALVGPGTGLGVGGLIFDRDGQVALVTEGGHVDFAPTTELEIDILRYLLRYHEHVSVERLLSGMGLTNLHKALCDIRGVAGGPLTPAQISAKALEMGDSTCLETLQIFCAMLGSVAGNTALTLGAQGGVFITGGIVPRMLDLFAASQFRARFEAKGRFRDYMAAIPTQVVIAEQPGLLGASAALYRHAF
ncbi:glucokinase [Marinobacterium sp. D7]|uniref:glucokinase n=1 Tax=Marinobacterium ramblicola TaxID=2849041 RepID=UPI001C2DCE4D|nr:glucokinase [Marinobacterium ramblicola]MBV1787670.1 glucokinase [Marinobacterium ramblicola]